MNVSIEEVQQRVDNGESALIIGEIQGRANELSYSKERQQKAYFESILCWNCGTGTRHAGATGTVKNKRLREEVMRTSTSGP